MREYAALNTGWRDAGTSTGGRASCLGVLVLVVQVYLAHKKLPTPYMYRGTSLIRDCPPPICTGVPRS